MTEDADAATTDQGRPWPRRLVIAAISIVGAYVAMIGIVNVALWCGAVEWAVSGRHRMTTIELDHGFAWTLWPSRIHVHDLDLKIDAYRYQLHLQMPQAVADIDLLALLSRRFHTRSIDGTDLRATFRFKAPLGVVPPRRRERFGEIEGFDPPIRTVFIPPLPPPDEAWELDLEGCRANVVHLWVDELELSPLDADVTGRLRSRAGDLFAVDDATLDVRSGTLKLGGETFADDWSGSVWAAVDDYDPFAEYGRDVLRRLHVDLDARARIVSLDPAEPLLPERAGLGLAGGEGDLELRVIVKAGRLQPDTRVAYDTGQLVVARGAWRGSAGVGIALDVHADDHGTPRARLGASLRRIRVDAGSRDDDDDEHAAIEAKRVEAFVVTTQTDLAGTGLPLVAGHLEIPRMYVNDAGALAEVSDPIRPRSGRLEATLVSDLVGPDRLHHHLEGKADTLSFSMERSHIRTSTTFDIEADSDQRLQHGRTDRIDVDINALAIDSPKGRSHGTWIDIARGHVQWSPDVIDARFAGRLDDLRPILEHSGDGEYLVARMPDLDLTKPLSFSVDLHRGSAGLDIHVLRLHRTGLQIEAFRHSEGDKARTAIRLERADIGITRDESSHRETEALADAAWFRRKVRWAKAM